MKWLALLTVIITIGQLQAYPKSEEARIINEDDIEAMEEVFFSQLLRMEQESSLMGINNELLQDETALEQTNALCPNPDECNCQIKTERYDTKEGSATCYSFKVPYCEGPCQSIHRYN